MLKTKLPSELNRIYKGDDQRLKVLIYPSLSVVKGFGLDAVDSRWFPLVPADFR